MIRRFILAASALATGSSAMAADTWNFAGDYGNSVFAYGSGTNGVSFTPFANVYASGCAGVASFACRSNGNNSLDANNLPAVGINTGTTPISVFTVTIPTGVLFTHPGVGTDADAIVRFIAPRAGRYTFDGAFSRLDNTSNGTGVNFTIIRNGVTINGGAGVLAPTAGATVLFGGGNGFGLQAGDILAFGVGNNGDVGFDSTGLSGNVALVPEPASWAMMIGGFGLLGGAARSRKRSRTVYA